MGHASIVCSGFIVANTHNIKFTILIILSLQFSCIKYIHTVMQWSPPFTPGTFSSPQIKILQPLNTSFLAAPGPSKFLSTFCLCGSLRGHWDLRCSARDELVAFKGRFICAYSPSQGLRHSLPLPLVRSAVALDSHRSMNPIVKCAF